MEELTLLAVAAVLIIVAATLFAQKHGIAAPVLLVLIGIGCSFIPGTPEVLVEPEWILMVVLPPILYSASVNVPITDFRRNLGSITVLSVFLVIGSAVATGMLLWWLMPEIGLAAAIALGAVVSPPDAVAAVSIGKRLGLPPRLVTVLEGEGLVNDATALVLLRTAVAAVAGSFSLWQAVGSFAYALVVGIAIGALVGVVSVGVRSRITQQPVLTTAISLVVPFVAFMPAEHIGASGVIAVVAAGLITGHQSAKKFTAHDRVTERTNWRTIQLLLENGVFLLMGYEITAVVAQVQASGRDIWTPVGIAVAVTGLLVVVRIAFVVPLIAGLRRKRARALEYAARITGVPEAVDAGREQLPAHHRGRGNRQASVQRRLRMLHSDALALAREGLGWRGGAVLAWSGMRGVVTLAAAQSLPHHVPHRAELVLIAFTVAVLSLVLQGGTLPALIRLLGIRGTDEQRMRQEMSRLAEEIAQARHVFLNSQTLLREDGTPFSAEVLEDIRHRAAQDSASIAALLELPEDHSPAAQRRELQAALLEVEQAVILDARAAGTYSSHTLEKAQHFIDAHATRP
ncbi:sodium:proton antiporter [Nesterenkonia rhizosphaerae]|uniref:Sodium:proton antiporter n=2 Tax=Nesterenkonia TaxID=57494 RepID=A0ABP9FYU3_9MICC